MSNFNKKSIIKPIVISVVAVAEVVIVLLLLALGFITGWTNTTRDTQLIDQFSDTILITTRASYMEPTYGKNDVLIIDKYEYGDKVEEEDIVCYYRYYNNELVLSTSRVESIESTGTNINIYNLKDDSTDGYSAMRITDRDIIGVYNGRKISGIGGMVESLASSSTLFFCSIVLPMIIVFVSNGGYIVYHILTRKNNDEDDEDEEDAEENEDNNTVDTENIVEKEEN